MTNLKLFKQTLDNIEGQVSKGFVVTTIGLVVEANCPGTYIGELCKIYPKSGQSEILCQVVGFREQKVLLLPFESLRGVTYGSKVVSLGHNVTVPVGDNYLGRVIDAFGKPIDGKGVIEEAVDVEMDSAPINPLDREPISDVFDTGITAIDTFLTLGAGQRVGLFSGSGVGKSSLLSDICKNRLTDDRVNIVVLVGERGREVEEFVSRTLGEEGLINSIVIAATAQESPLVRVQSVNYALALAEYFSQQGKEVLLTIDSMTRFAMALREIGLAIGEPPTLKGYTTSVFSAIPKIVERCGKFKGRGSITAIFTVLVENDDFNDPVVDTLRAILDGHIVLTRQLAERYHFPAIDILKSVSRLFTDLSTVEQRESLLKVRKAWLNYEDNKELLEIGMVEGENSNAQHIKNNYQAICDFLQQPKNKHINRDTMFKCLNELELHDV
ncbi:Flagellum-specific ATP synthase [Pseudoalteromonas holothuriae]|uniref:protein-secreting ATPase n=1 Tax=Pseudoalteromonas holothuriae TaxID=2963714 RepID=A0A9W4R0Q8_9GAMM|nr:MULTISPECIES: FliI/YscN family ATPase [unclassified Pseudoalteromonas]CAH9051056.1 Flagellum-specific ATP synthase [Pseudoalteromonas sp. CIP111951]CAH9061714.1 Flagellum-specific ATP synthase [Pseudoalteromonas sp. CIP111854]